MNTSETEYLDVIADDDEWELAPPQAGAKTTSILVQPGVAERFCWMFCCLILSGIAIRFIWLILCFGSCLLFGAIQMLFVTRRSIAFGSARLAEHKDLEAAGLLGESGLILGRSLPKRYPLFPAVRRLFTAPLKDSAEVVAAFRLAILFRKDWNTKLIRLSTYCHGLIVAPPGCGKSVGIAMPALLTHKGSMVVTDPKGELAKLSGQVRKKHLQQKVVLLDPFGIVDSNGAKLNPLAHIDALAANVVDQCGAIADAMIVQTGAEHDPHWNETARIALTAIILFVLLFAMKRDRTLNTVADILLDPVAFQGTVAIMRDAPEHPNAQVGNAHAFRSLQRFGNAMSSWQERELSSILSSVGRHLSWLNSPVIEEHLSESSFDPRTINDGSTTVYLILPPKYLSSLSRLQRLWLTTIYQAITETEEQGRRTVLFLLDEIAQIGPIPAIYQSITLGRGLGIRTFLFVQSLAQLKTIFPKDGEHQAVEASIDHKIFFGIRDYATAEAVSNYLGSQTIQIESQTSGTSTTRPGLMSILTSKNPQHATYSTSRSMTQSETGRKLLHPDEILNLPSNAVLIFGKDIPPIMASLAPYFATPELEDVRRLIPEQSERS